MKNQNSRTISDSTFIYGSILTTYAVATLSVNAIFYTAQTAVEAVERAPRKEFVATLKDSRLYSGPISSANVHLWLADVEDSNGQTHSLVDSVRLLEGKFRANSVLPNLKSGQVYRFTTIDSMFGKTIVDAKEVK